MVYLHISLIRMVTRIKVFQLSQNNKDGLHIYNKLLDIWGNKVSQLRKMMNYRNRPNMWWPPAWNRVIESRFTNDDDSVHSQEAHNNKVNVDWRANKSKMFTYQIIPASAGFFHLLLFFCAWFSCFCWHLHKLYISTSNISINGH